MFDKNGIAIPETFDELESAMQQFVDKGITPAAFEGNDWLRSICGISNCLRPIASLLTIINPMSTTSTSPVSHSPMLRTSSPSGSRKGYLPSNSGGLVAEDMITQFCAGEYSIMFFWLVVVRTCQSDGNFKSTFRALPGNEKLNTGATGKLWVVPKPQAYIGLAADFRTSCSPKDVQNMLATEAGLPFNASDDYSIDSLPDELRIR